MNKIVLASGNPGKIKELNKLFGERGINIVPQSEFGVSTAEETACTFVENALIKARHAAQSTGLPAIADDSGIEIDALEGAPGVYSARYAGAGANDQANNDKLLEALKDVPESKRGARYQCVLVYLRHAQDPTPIICQGSWEGRILLGPRGEGGFGYDPLFYVEPHQCSAAELPAAIKNSISHRALALKALVDRLK